MKKFNAVKIIFDKLSDFELIYSHFRSQLLAVVAITVHRGLISLCFVGSAEIISIENKTLSRH